MILLKLIIHVGVSKADTQISVEKQSFNLEYCHLDITNSCPENECCVTEGPEILETGLDVDRLCNASNGKLRNFNYKGIFRIFLFSLKTRMDNILFF